jgi:hypothetical protein
VHRRAWARLTLDPVAAPLLVKAVEQFASSAAPCTRSCAANSSSGGPQRGSSSRTVIGRASRPALIMAGRRGPKWGSRRVGEFASEWAGQGAQGHVVSKPVRQRFRDSALRVCYSPVGSSAIKEGITSDQYGARVARRCTCIDTRRGARYLALCTYRCTRLREACGERSATLCRSQLATAPAAGLAGQGTRRPRHSTRTLHRLRRVLQHGRAYGPSPGYQGGW